MENCAVCGDVATRPVRLIADGMAVGACCERCSGSLHGSGVLGHEVANLVTSLVDGEDLDYPSTGENVLSGLWSFTARYIRYHLHQERDLSTLKTFLGYIHSTRGRED
jgi:hypothetical protein